MINEYINRVMIIIYNYILYILKIENREKVVVNGVSVLALTSVHQAAVSGRKRQHVVALLHDRHVKRVVVNAPVCFIHTDGEAGSRVANGMERRVWVQRGINC